MVLIEGAFLNITCSSVDVVEQFFSYSCVVFYYFFQFSV